MNHNHIPQWNLSYWINSQPLEISSLQGKPTLVHFFQMFCPSCVLHSLPTLQHLWNERDKLDLQVIAIHSVFEHHAQMAPDALSVFIQEFRYTFPIAIDVHNGSDPVPGTMRQWSIQGTPSSVLLDADGMEVWRHFGRLDLGTYEDVIRSNGRAPVMGGGPLCPVMGDRS
ncbi:MAG: TlpA family protein disulfide reductase [Acidobacteria bacterium]|nr:TlpA family protein disulfide reductase [Acidobacteriota bacterium]